MSQEAKIRVSVTQLHRVLHPIEYHNACQDECALPQIFSDLLLTLYLFLVQGD